MKTKIAVLMSVLFTLSAVAGVPWQIDTTTPHIVGTNTVYGDIFPMPFDKENSNTTFFAAVNTTNANKIASTAASLVVVSNWFRGASNTVALHTLQIGTNAAAINSLSLNTSNGFANLQGTNIVPGTINSNALDSATLGWLQSIAMATMNFDSGTITSDGSGNITAVSIKANLVDLYYGTGSSGYFPRANGDGTFNWTAWPTTLNYDGGTVTSDGSGNVAGTSWRGGLLDNGYSSGGTGYVPVANGDGTWTWGAGGGGGATIDVTNPITGAPGTSVLVTNLGSTVAAIFQFTIPRGYNGTNGTNFVTVNQFTNVVLSSQRLVTYSTNNITWSTSNFLARVTGYYDNDIYGGQLGGSGLAPGTNVFIKLVGSLTGTNAWFTITNGYQTTNLISIAAVGAGGGLGNAKLYSVDHFELLGRTNSFFGQHYQFDTPFNGSDAATKAYCDSAIANALDGHFVGGNVGNIYHLTYNHGNGNALDIGSSVLWASNVTATVDGTGTNVAITFPTNSLTSWRVVSSTNLTLANGFTTYTNWTATTNTGIVTVLSPINFGEPMRFYSIQGPGTDTFTVASPITALGGTIYPSNTWNLAAITNALGNMGFWQGSSNGLSVCQVHLSNGVVRIKQLTTP